MVRVLRRLLMLVFAMCFAVASAQEVHRHSDAGPCLQCLFENSEERKIGVGKRMSVPSSISVRVEYRLPETAEPPTVVAVVGVMPPRPVWVLAQCLAYQSANRILGPPPPRPIEPDDDVGAPRAPPAFE